MLAPASYGLGFALDRASKKSRGLVRGGARLRLRAVGRYCKVPTGAVEGHELIFFFSHLLFFISFLRSFVMRGEFGRRPRGRYMGMG